MKPFYATSLLTVTPVLAEELKLSCKQSSGYDKDNTTKTI